MNELLTKFLIELGESLKDAKDFTVEQIPLVAKEYLEYTFISSMLNMVLMLVFAVVIGIISIKLINRGREISKEDDKNNIKFPYRRDSAIGFMVSGGLLSVFVFFSVAEATSHLQLALKVKYAPRVFLIEKAAQLLKK